MKIMSCDWQWRRWRRRYNAEFRWEVIPKTCRSDWYGSVV